MKNFLVNLCLVSVSILVLIIQHACQKEEDVCPVVDTYNLNCVFLDGSCDRGFQSISSKTVIRFYGEGSIVLNTCSKQYKKTFKGSIDDFTLFGDNLENWVVNKDGSYKVSPDSSYILLNNNSDTVFFHPGPDTAYEKTFDGPWIEQKGYFQYKHLVVSGVFIFEKK